MRPELPIERLIKLYAHEPPPTAAPHRQPRRLSVPPAVAGSDWQSLRTTTGAPARDRLSINLSAQSPLPRRHEGGRA
jgi:hypothetical protein